MIMIGFSGCTPKAVELAESGTIENIKQELKKEEDIYQSFAWSAYYGKIDKVKYFIDQGMNLNYNKQHDMYDFYPVVFAAVHGNHINIVKLLVESGADINIKHRRSGDTALSRAAWLGHLDIVKYLVEQGADIYTSGNNYDGSSIKLLKDKGHGDFVSMLIKIQEDKKSKQQIKKLAEENILKKENQLLETKKQKEQIDTFILEKDFISLKNYTEKYPYTVNFISQSELRLALTGPKDFKVGDIRKLVLRGTDENIIISLIKRVKVPYKEFTVEEINLILDMGLNSKMVSAMIDRTTQLMDSDKLRKEQEYFLAEQNKIANQKIKTNTTKKVDIQDNLINKKIQNEVIKQGIGMLLDQLF